MKDDKNTSISELKKEIGGFVAERCWDRFQNLRSLAISLSLESNEFLDRFQWLNDKELKELENDKSSYDQYTEDLCDILSYILIAANRLGVDITSSFYRKLEKNKKKYPVNELRGLSWEEDNKKYQSLRKKWKEKQN